MNRPRQHKTKAAVYVALIIALIPVVAVGLLLAVVYGGKLIMSLRGGPGPHYYDDLTLWVILIAWLVLACPIILMVGVMIAVSVWRRETRPHAAGCCLHCGYDLRGSIDVSDGCPECGRRS